MKKRIFSVLAIFNFSLYLSMRSIWSGIEGMFKIHALQYIIFLILTALFITSIIAHFIKFNDKILVSLIGLSIALLIGLFYMLYLGIDSYRFFVKTFFVILSYLLIAYFLYFLIFKFPYCRLSKNKTYKSVLFGLLMVMIIVYATNLDFHYITNKPVVYMVEDTYQIVWTTSTNATAEVRVGDEIYYDLYAGSENSETTVHKVVVPMSVLDAEKSYTISSTHVIYRGPYSGILGGTVEKTFNFYPVDTTDGLKYYTVSDSHTQNKSAIKAATYYGEELDFFIMAGDIMNHIEDKSDAEVILKMAHKVTNGERPVIYARGNHEVKGTYANQLHRYVGSLNESFYYTVTFSNVFGVVLDLGEDHEDSWWEYYDTAQYDLYRNEQTNFLQEIIDEADYDNPAIIYRIGICHIPVALVEDEFLDSILNEWAPLLSTINFDVFISGHKHQLLAFSPDIPALVDFNYHENYRDDDYLVGYRTDVNFTNFIASRRSSVQSVLIKENLFGGAFTGLAAEVSFEDNQSIFTYTNHLQEIVPVVNPYTGELQENYVIPLD
jgi:predicted phosphodiesterase